MQIPEIGRAPLEDNLPELFRDFISIQEIKVQILRIIGLEIDLRLRFLAASMIAFSSSLTRS